MDLLVHRSCGICRRRHGLPLRSRSNLQCLLLCCLHSLGLKMSKGQDARIVCPNGSVAMLVCFAQASGRCEKGTCPVCATCKPTLSEADARCLKIRYNSLAMESGGRLHLICKRPACWRPVSTAHRTLGLCQAYMNYGNCSGRSGSC